MTPALTAEEWRCALVERDGELGYLRDERVERLSRGDLDIPQAMRHPLAALCLSGQPFGFTREDVVRLVDAMGTMECGGEAQSAFADWRQGLQSIADRIEALLPPEETS